MEDLRKLEKIIKLCRKTGVNRVKFDGIELDLAPLEAKPLSRYLKKKIEKKPLESAPSVLKTQEELLFWSAGNPADDLLRQSVPQ